MIQGIGSQSSSALANIEAALKAHTAASKRIEAQLANSAGAAAGASPSTTAVSDFTKALSDGLRTANSEVNKVEALPGELITAKVSDFHEVAAQVKQAELTFKFALEIRNKLIDAYRETMRMNV